MMKLALIVLVSLNLVYGRSFDRESEPSHNEDRAHRRPNFYTMCRQVRQMVSKWIKIKEFKLDLKPSVQPTAQSLQCGLLQVLV